MCRLRLSNIRMMARIGSPSCARELVSRSVAELARELQGCADVAEASRNSQLAARADDVPGGHCVVPAAPHPRVRVDLCAYGLAGHRGHARPANQAHGLIC